MSAVSVEPTPGVAVVTGATSGLGHEIALEVAQRGVTVVVVGRGADRAAAAAQAIARASGNPRVESVGVDDLSRLAEVRRLAALLLERYPRISLLVNNAGAVYMRRGTTAEGIERTFALNVLAPLLLTELLADRLKASAPSRVVNIASSAHTGQAVPFDDLQFALRRYPGYTVYGTSKLELILLTRELGRRMAGTGVTVNAVHPGFVATNFAQNNGGGTAVVVRILSKLFGRSVRHGAETPVLVATDPSLSSVTGAYFADRRVHPGDPASQDPAAARRLYDLCESILHPAAGAS
jgi:NAD(P)-dependent dehydrogenase (short-subunit alcohol dehydrogenase family)